jgi:hypothetical protein
MNDPETLRLFEAHRKAEAARDYDAIRATFTEACFSETVTARAAKTRQRRTRAAYEALFTALPDPSHNDQGRALGDDVVVVWGHFARTNDGDWLGVPPAADPCRAVCRRRALQGRRDTRRDDLAPPRTLCDRPGSTSTGSGGRQGQGQQAAIQASGRAALPAKPCCCARERHRTLRPTAGLRPVQDSGVCITASTAARARAGSREGRTRGRELGPDRSVQDSGAGEIAIYKPRHPTPLREFARRLTRPLRSPGAGW